MPEQLWFTAFLNHHLAGVVTAMMRHLGMPPAYAAAPITNFVAMELLVFAILITFFILVRVRLSAESPDAIQHVAEMFEEFVSGQIRDVIGHGGERFTPFLVTLFLFILLGNLIGIVPGFESPTASPQVPLGLAVLAFLYYHFYGFKKHGVLRYLKHFLGPLGPDIHWLVRIPLQMLLLVIETISHLARLLSLTVRLYANMFAGDTITLIVFSLVPLLLPAGALGFHIFVSLLQAYIFMLLTIIYLQGAVTEQEH